jgi:hypothetical protein
MTLAEIHFRGSRRGRSPQRPLARATALAALQVDEADIRCLGKTLAHKRPSELLAGFRGCFRRLGSFLHSDCDLERSLLCAL